MGKFFAAIVGILAIFAIVMIISLFFIKIGWSLFIVPVFGLPELTWMQALGFSFLASSFKSYNTSTKKD